MKPAALLASLILLAPGAARAGCDVQVAALAFGVIQTGRTSQATGKVTIRCDAPQSLQVGLSGGGGGAERRLAGPGPDVIPYFVFADPGGAMPWGDGMVIGPALGVTVSGTQPVDLPAYGVIPPVPGTPPGTYVDSLMVTITF
ncbi:spore coat protein U domain-containing protein [Geminicoccus roseus]|uniref:spore coat protein U domain-containing protein n=1 Tax=Geminicoccus roseus TaxID=404900 RepID=UPI00042583AF|nr:spore coat protein U domain-containing protein [Geminicoccus roseus]